MWKLLALMLGVAGAANALEGGTLTLTGTGNVISATTQGAIGSVTTMYGRTASYTNLYVGGVAVTAGGAQDRITSGTANVIANTDGGYVSLTQGSTTWGYLGSSATQLPYISSTAGGKVSSTYVYGRDASFTTITGSGTGITGVTAINPVYEYISVTIASDTNNLQIAGINPSASVVTEVGISATSSFVLSGISPSTPGGVAFEDGKVIILRNNTTFDTADSYVMIHERNSTKSNANARLYYAPSRFALIGMPQDFLAYRRSNTDNRWNFIGGNRHSNPAQFCDDWNDYVLSNDACFVNGSGTCNRSGANAVSMIGIGTGYADTGATISGSSYLGASNNDFAFGRGAALFIERGAPEQLSTAAQTSRVSVGWGDAGTGNHTDALSFMYNQSASTVAYQTVSAEAGTSTSITEVNAIVSTTTMLTKGIFVNGNATRADYFVTTNETYTFLASHNTNIPDAGDYLGTRVGLLKIAGTTRHFYDSDWVCVRYQWP